MATFQRFEEMQVWQKARQATKCVYEITRNEIFSRDFGLANQIRRASVSVMANIAEGNGRKSNKDFANFLVMSHGSAAEVQSHLYIALDLGYINENEFSEIYKLFDEISRMTMSLCKHLQKI
ncbi:MAG TPA: four helix bundle protein [Pyrinomonadaceae bacterium]|jgi:four helix bundle protein|nr:four helix bundle protein [Pyrinomonadaceae bacterium]